MRVGYCNLAFTTGQRKDQHNVDLLIKRGYEYLGFVEANVDDLREMVPEDWRARQNMNAPSGKSGCAAAWSPRVRIFKRRRLRLGVDPAQGDRRAKMRKRWLLMNDVRIDRVPTRLLIGHWPPPRFDWLQPFMTAAVKFWLRRSPRRGYWVVMGDYNMPLAKVARQLGGRPYGEGIDGFVLGPNVYARDLEVIRRVEREGWTDHPAIGADIHTKER